MPSKTQPAARDTPSLSRRFLITIVTIVSVCLLLSNIAFWFNKNIFTTNTFSDTVTPVLLSESSTQALASEVSERLLQNRPVLKSTVSNRVESLIAALLRTDLSERIVTKSVSTLHTSITSANPQPVAIDLTSIKGIMAQLFTIGRQLTGQTDEAPRVDINDLPDEIVLFDPSTLPNIYNIGIITLIVAPIAFITAIVLFGYAFYRAYRLGRIQMKRFLGAQGGALILAGVLGLILARILTPIILGQVNSMNVRVVMENILSAFFGTLNQQFVAGMIVPAMVLLLGALVLHFWPQLQSFIQEKRSVKH